MFGHTPVLMPDPEYAELHCWSNLAGADLGPKIFAIMSGHITRLTIGDTV